MNVKFGPTVAEGAHGGTGIVLYKNWLYAEIDDRIVRYALKEGETAPSAKPETILSGMPLNGDIPCIPSPSMPKAIYLYRWERLQMPARCRNACRTLQATTLAPSLNSRRHLALRRQQA